MMRMSGQFHGMLFGYRRNQVKKEMIREEAEYQKTLAEYQSRFLKLTEKNHQLKNQIEGLENTRPEQTDLAERLLNAHIKACGDILDTKQKCDDLVKSKTILLDEKTLEIQKIQKFIYQLLLQLKTVSQEKKCL